MKTSALIETLISDHRTQPALAGSLWRGLAMALAPVVIMAFLFWGVRADLLDGASLLAAAFKASFGVFALFLAFSCSLELSRPECKLSGLVWHLVLFLGVSVTALTLENVSGSSQSFLSNLSADMAYRCLSAIPVLSIPPLLMVLSALRRGATTHRKLSGAAAGLLASTIGIAIYAMVCTVDTITHVVIWYSVAALFMAGIGAIVGEKILRW